jgi:hypothetical protein
LFRTRCPKPLIATPEAKPKKPVQGAKLAKKAKAAKKAGG